MSGRKNDEGKPALYQGVLRYFPRALSVVAKVSAYGLEKYGLRYEDRGFARVEQGQARYSDALVRHLQEGSDEESGLPHSWHAAWCALARLELELELGERQDELDRVERVSTNGEIG